MSAIDTLDPVAREICVAEITKHREEAYNLGLAEGRKQASPLAVGGCDAVRNLQWLPAALKSCAGTVCKDRWERKVYAR